MSSMKEVHKFPQGRARIDRFKPEVGAVDCAKTLKPLLHPWVRAVVEVPRRRSEALSPSLSCDIEHAVAKASSNCWRNDRTAAAERAKTGERRSGIGNGGRSREKERKSNTRWRWRDWYQGVAMGKLKGVGKKVGERRDDQSVDKGTVARREGKGRWEPGRLEGAESLG